MLDKLLGYVGLDFEQDKLGGLEVFRVEDEGHHADGRGLDKLRDIGAPGADRVVGGVVESLKARHCHRPPAQPRYQQAPRSG